VSGQSGKAYWTTADELLQARPDGGNHWTVFNGAGAVVCDNMPLDVARAYLTPERAERGWLAAYTVIVRDPSEFPDRAEASVEVTEAMVEAGKDERMRCFKEPTLDVGTALTRIYKAMNAAGVPASGEAA
jgi:hypothetical protein